MNSHQILDSNLIFNMMPLKSKQNLGFVQQLLMKQIEHSMQLCMSIFMPNQASIRQQNCKKNETQNQASSIEKQNINVKLNQKQIFMELENKFSQLKSIMQKFSSILNQSKTLQLQKDTYQQGTKLLKQQEAFLSYILLQVGLTSSKMIRQSSFSIVVQQAKQKYQKIHSKQYLNNVKRMAINLKPGNYDENLSKQISLQNYSIQKIKAKLEFTNESELQLWDSYEEVRDKLIASECSLDVRGYTSIKMQNPITQTKIQTQNRVQNIFPSPENQVKSIIRNWQQNLRLKR